MNPLEWAELYGVKIERYGTGVRITVEKDGDEVLDLKIAPYTPSPFRNPDDKKELYTDILSFLSYYADGIYFHPEREPEAFSLKHDAWELLKALPKEAGGELAFSVFFDGEEEVE